MNHTLENQKETRLEMNDLKVCTFFHQLLTRVVTWRFWFCLCCMWKILYLFSILAPESKLEIATSFLICSTISLNPPALLGAFRMVKVVRVKLEYSHPNFLALSLRWKHGQITRQIRYMNNVTENYLQQIQKNNNFVEPAHFWPGKVLK